MPCTLTLARYLQLPVTPLLTKEVTRVIDEQVYQRAVFFVRPLGFITSTHVRRISCPDSLRFEATHKAVYREHGFHLVEISAATINHRAAAIDSYICSQPGSSPGQGAPCRAN